ncbi:MAG: 4-diphosphocytidyl-2-C-methyl-D-erythritol kinase [bacterium]|nr:MAG: 4-diphosphocytidyl-2-C-methyl-D-erythritol kinase [bacterium]
MILFPPAKINLGLRVTAKRNDSFHNVESFLYPIPLQDVLEFREAAVCQLKLYGKPIPGRLSENLLCKTWKLLKKHYDISPVEIHLLKSIPAGSGLGGGSSDAAFFLKGLNDFFQLRITDEKLMDLAAQLGSDCPFFIQNTPALVSGKGEIAETFQLDMSGLYLVLIVPDVHLSTGHIFSMIKPGTPDLSISEIIKLPITRWQSLLRNDFEKIVFIRYPVLAKLKQEFINRGTLYASMTGTGSALYGLFETKPEINNLAKYGTTYQYRL